jgi:hypothetical protein
MFVSDFDPCSRDEFQDGLTTLETAGSVILVVGNVEDSAFSYMSAQFFGDPALDRIPFVGSPDPEPEFDERLADAGFDPDARVNHHVLSVTEPDPETVHNRLSRALWLHSGPDDVDPGALRVGLEITSLIETNDPDSLLEPLSAIRDLSKQFRTMTHLVYRDSLESLLETLDQDQLSSPLDIIVRLRDGDSENPEQQWVLLEQECTSDWIDPSSILG